MKVLVAGATGRLGRQVALELKRRGQQVRALVRKPESVGNVLRSQVDEVFVADLGRPETLAGACEGVEAVFSSVGAPLSLSLSESTGYREVDYAGNVNLLEEARRAGAGRFVYVSVFGAERLRGLEYVDAHEEFVAELKRSGMAHSVVRPTGFFSAMEEILKMAARGPVASIGDGSSRTNPVHEADLANVCADALEGGPAEIEVGGPTVYTRREITEMAFRALGKKPRTFRMPPPVLRLMVGSLRPFNRRLSALMSFFIAVAQTDLVAPPTGERRLEDYFYEVARKRA